MSRAVAVTCDVCGKAMSETTYHIKLKDDHEPPLFAKQWRAGRPDVCPDCLRAALPTIRYYDGSKWVLLVGEVSP